MRFMLRLIFVQSYCNFFEAFAAHIVLMAQSPAPHTQTHKHTNRICESEGELIVIVLFDTKPIGKIAT